MKPPLALSIMLAAAGLTCVWSFGERQPWIGVGLLVVSLCPILSFIGGVRAWKPWFMAGIVDDDMPPVTVFAWLALIAEAVVIVGLWLDAGPALIAVRLLLAVAQMAVSGKLSREVGTPQSDENCRTPSSRPVPRDARKP